MIYRVFAPTELNVPPGRLAGAMHAAGFRAEPHFKGDDLGWTGGKLVLAGGAPVQLDRYLTDADDLRDDLNAFAAELETMSFSPEHVLLMELVIQTKQLIALRQPIDHADEAHLEKLCTWLARYFATELGGIYQVDGKGYFAADGTLRLQEY